MGRFDEFELAIQKTNDFPLTYETVIPRECSFFQDVRRYQCLSTHLDIRAIKVDGEIRLEADMEPVPMTRLTRMEKKELIDYLKIRVARGDNIGYTWAFFRSRGKKAPLVAYGANIVHKDASVGQERVRRLMSCLQKSKVTHWFQKQWITRLGLGVVIAAVLFAGFKYGPLVKQFPFKRIEKYTKTPEMEFYQSVFPDVFAWQNQEMPSLKEAAEALLKPEYVSGLLSAMENPFHKDENARDNNQGRRLVLFVYFNYNARVAETIKRHQTDLQGTEFMRLARIYSCRESGYTSNIFYYKVGDLNIRDAEINTFLQRNMITYQDFQKIRDANTFSELMEKENISFKMKSFLQDVYTFTPLKIDSPMEGRQWYLLTQKDGSGELAFAAFFQRENATLVPKRIGSLLLDKKPGPDISWYALTDAQAGALKLSKDALTYFTKTSGQALKLGVITDKIRSLGLTPVSGYVQVSVHRELLMGDEKGKYGIQTYDPLASLVLSNLITKSSFEEESKVVLKRDPIQINTTLVQLSKDDSLSVQSITITPGTTGIIRLFEPADSFSARFADGKTAIFEKADVNLFNPYTYMITHDSITFSFRHDITDMEIDLDKERLKIIKTSDGNHQIIETN